jgi:hypothetical protein
VDQDLTKLDHYSLASDDVSQVDLQYIALSLSSASTHKKKTCANLLHPTVDLIIASFAAAGNLLVLPDGRVGFIDFGIVGRISPVTWKAMEALLASLAVGDYETMARALATIGACRCVLGLG